MIVIISSLFQGYLVVNLSLIPREEGLHGAPGMALLLLVFEVGAIIGRVFKILMPPRIFLAAIGFGYGLTIIVHQLISELLVDS